MAQRSGFWVVLLAVLLIGLLVAVPMLGMIMWRPMMMGGGMMGGWGYPTGMRWGLVTVGMLIPLGFIVLLIVGAYYFLTSREETVEAGNALRILDERYAKGELTKAQYLEMKENITKK